MIIIRTANGCEFINEKNIQRLTHDKKEASVFISQEKTFSPMSTIRMVESVTYTNKENMEFVDNGLMMTAVLKDREFHRQYRKSVHDYAKGLYDQRNDLELFIIRNKELFTDDYQKHFIEQLCKKRRERPGTMDDEIFNYQKMPYYDAIRKHADQYGEEVTKMFIKLEEKIEENKQNKSSEDNELFAKIRHMRKTIFDQQGEIERLKQRSLWERITRKGE